MTWIKIAGAKAILTKTDILGGPNDPTSQSCHKSGKIHCSTRAAVYTDDFYANLGGEDPSSRLTGRSPSRDPCRQTLHDY